MITYQDLENKKRELELRGEFIPQFPTCLGKCDECEYRAELWAEIMGCSGGEIEDAVFDN